MNNKGFTLIELLATVTLLSVLMIIAVPNIIGVVNRNKNKSYVEDAKKLVSLAEYKVRSDSTLKPPVGSNQVYCFTMGYLGGEEFGTAPNGGKYSTTKSYVSVSFDGGSKLNYYVQLVEYKCKDPNHCLETDATNKIYGISKKLSSDLYGDNPALVVDNPTNAGVCAGSKTDGK